MEYFVACVMSLSALLFFASEPTVVCGRQSTAELVLVIEPKSELVLSGDSNLHYEEYPNKAVIHYQKHI